MKKLSLTLLLILSLTLVACGNKQPATPKQTTSPNNIQRTETPEPQPTDNKVLDNSDIPDYVWERLENTSTPDTADLTQYPGVYTDLSNHDEYTFISSYHTYHSSDEYQERDSIIDNLYGILEISVDEIHTPYYNLVVSEVPNMTFEEFMQPFFNNEHMSIWSCKLYPFDNTDTSIENRPVSVGRGTFTYENMTEMLPKCSMVELEFTSGGDDPIMYIINIMTKELENGSTLDSIRIDLSASDESWEKEEFDTQVYFRTYRCSMDFNTHKSDLESDMSTYLKEIMQEDFTK